jgi:hypothetical protein
VAKIQEKIQELEKQKQELDEQIEALKTAQKIMGGSVATRQTRAKKATKVKRQKEKAPRSTKKSRRGRRMKRRGADQKTADKKAILSAIDSGVGKAKPIGEIAKATGRSSDVTLSNDVRELLEEGKIKKQGERAKTVYYK